MHDWLFLTIVNSCDHDLAFMLGNSVFMVFLSETVFSKKLFSLLESMHP